jgi:hypothetical protein
MVYHRRGAVNPSGHRAGRFARRAPRQPAGCGIHDHGKTAKKPKSVKKTVKVKDLKVKGASKVKGGIIWKEATHKFL